MVTSYMEINVSLPFACRKIGNECGPDNPVWAEVRSHGKEMAISRGVYFQPASDKDIYFVDKGRFNSVFVNRKGKRRQLLEYETGSVLNLTRAVLKSVSFLEYMATEDSILWKIPIDNVISDKPQCPYLTQISLRILASVMETYYTGLTYLKIDNLNKAFCRYLILAMRNANSNNFSPGLTQEDCASMLGMHRATLAGIIKDLKNSGIIGCYTSKKVTILDKDRLLQLADF